jgi:hypothetical protein
MALDEKMKPETLIYIGAALSVVGAIVASTSLVSNSQRQCPFPQCGEVPTFHIGSLLIGYLANLIASARPGNQADEPMGALAGRYPTADDTRRPVALAWE